MEFLNLGGPADDAEVGRRAPISKSKKKIFALVGVGVLAATIGVGTTLASSITLNSGSVEFGQGVSATAACEHSDTITVTPLSSYDNSTTSFTLSGINLSGIDTTCEGKYLKISLWSANAAPLMDFSLQVPAARVDSTATDGTGWNVAYDSSNSGGGAAADSVTITDATDSTFAVSLSSILNNTYSVPSNDLYSITVESSATAPTLSGEQLGGAFSASA